MLQNIRYAKPITRLNRHTLPEPIKHEPRFGDFPSFNQGRNHTHYTTLCPQPSDSPVSWLITDAGMVVSEDCLLLHIFVPLVDQFSGYPIYIHLHGGFLAWGSPAEYGVAGIIHNMVSKGVVVVLVQSRLGPYGYLNVNTGGEVGSRLSNIGLEDQLLAIKWVDDVSFCDLQCCWMEINLKLQKLQHIHFFRGDSARITLGGSGAGACAAAYHAASNYHPPLFRSVNLMSGSLGTCHDFIHARTKLSFTTKFINATCPDSHSLNDSLAAVNGTRLLDCLDSLSMEQMLKADLGAGMWEMAPLPPRPDANTTDTDAPPPLNILMGVSGDAWLPIEMELMRTGNTDILHDVDVNDHPRRYLLRDFHAVFPDIDKDEREL